MTVIPWPGTGGAEQPGSRPDTSSVSTTAALLARVAGIAPDITARLVEHDGALDALRRVDAPTLRRAYGLTDRQARRLRDALDLTTRLLLEPRQERAQVASPRDAARLLLPEMGVLEQEEMRLLLLDTKHRLIAVVPLYAGTVDACHVRVGEVFREAVRRNATALIVAHNHPSGSVDPSPEDVRVTTDLVQAGRLLDVEVLDHLIVAHDRYTSLHERGLGWR